LIDIRKIKLAIIERLLPLDPDKIILFGSYAYGVPNEDSDIDLLLLKDNLTVENIKKYKLELQKKYLLGIDLFVDSTLQMRDRIENVKNQFYDDILYKGKVIYAK
jgi:predicted nucleotidyltransferase